MIIQSGGMKYYAVLALSDSYELGLLPIVSNVAQTAVVTIRCRYRSIQTDWFDATLVPKPVLLGGVERSKNTLRGVVHLNTGVPLHKMSANFGKKAGDLVVSLADGYLIGEDFPLQKKDIRDDFVEDFAKLMENQLSKFVGVNLGKPALLSAMDLAMVAEQGAVLPDPGQASVQEQDTNVVKVGFGQKVDEADEGELKQGVDEAPADVPDNTPA